MSKNTPDEKRRRINYHIEQMEVDEVVAESEVRSAHYKAALVIVQERPDLVANVMTREQIMECWRTQ